MEALEGRELLSTCTVTSLDGTGTGPGTLRSAINQAESNAGSTINFTVTGTISLTTALPALTANTTITGPGSSSLTIAGGGTSSNFSILTVSKAVSVAVSGLTLTNGHTTTTLIVGGSPTQFASGGITNRGMLALTDCTISGDSATDNSTKGGGGGGIYSSGTLALTGCTISGDSLTVNSTNGGGGGGIYSSGMLALTGCTISGDSLVQNNPQFVLGDPGGGGGGIYNGDTMTANNCTFSSDMARGIDSFGGGILNHGTMTGDDCTFLGGLAEVDGGGIDNQKNLTLRDSTLSGDTGYYGGGITNEFDGTMTIVNSTIAANHAVTYGGGIGNLGALLVSECTISGNSITSGEGAGIDCSRSSATISTTTLDNSIIAGNGTADDVYGTVVLISENNLIGRIIEPIPGNSTLTNGVNGNIVGVTNPGLGPLANNGGPTQTMALLPGSPAINAGNNGLAVDPATNQPLTTDQRGFSFSRVIGANVDIGAFEYTKEPVDFDGDGKSDFGVFQPTTSTFDIVPSTNSGQPTGSSFGQGTNAGGAPVPITGDFDGDGRSDIGVFQSSTSTFFIDPSSNPGHPYAVQFGQGTISGGGPIPIVGDFDGDGKADFGVFQPSTSTFYFDESTSGKIAVQFGQGTNSGGAPLPIVGDFDGDAKADFGVFQPTTSTFDFDDSTAGKYVVQFGQGTNSGGSPVPIVGDFDGNGDADFGVFQPSTSTFDFDDDNPVLFSGNGTAGTRAVQFGQGTNGGGSPIPIVGDYDGDGKSDFGVFQPTTSTFYFDETTAGGGFVQFGQGTNSGGSPVPLSALPAYNQAISGFDLGRSVRAVPSTSDTTLAMPLTVSVHTNTTWVRSTAVATPSNFAKTIPSAGLARRLSLISLIPDRRHDVSSWLSYSTILN